MRGPGCCVFWLIMILVCTESAVSVGNAHGLGGKKQHRRHPNHHPSFHEELEEQGGSEAESAAETGDSSMTDEAPPKKVNSSDFKYDDIVGCQAHRLAIANIALQLAGRISSPTSGPACPRHVSESLRCAFDSINFNLLHLDNEPIPQAHKCHMYDKASGYGNGFFSTRPDRKWQWAIFRTQQETGETELQTMETKYNNTLSIFKSKKLISFVRGAKMNNIGLTVSDEHVGATLSIVQMVTMLRSLQQDLLGMDTKARNVAVNRILRVAGDRMDAETLVFMSRVEESEAQTFLQGIDSSEGISVEKIRDRAKEVYAKDQTYKTEPLYTAVVPAVFVKEKMRGELLGRLPSRLHREEGQAEKVLKVLIDIHIDQGLSKKQAETIMDLVPEKLRQHSGSDSIPDFDGILDHVFDIMGTDGPGEEKMIKVADLEDATMRKKVVEKIVQEQALYYGKILAEKLENKIRNLEEEGTDDMQKVDLEIGLEQILNEIQMHFALHSRETPQEAVEVVKTELHPLTEKVVAKATNKLVESLADKLQPYKIKIPDSILAQGNSELSKVINKALDDALDKVAAKVQSAYPGKIPVDVVSLFRAVLYQLNDIEKVQTRQIINTFKMCKNLRIFVNSDNPVVSFVEDKITLQKLLKLAVTDIKSKVEAGKVVMSVFGLGGLENRVLQDILDERVGETSVGELVGLAEKLSAQTHNVTRVYGETYDLLKKYAGSVDDPSSLAAEDDPITQSIKYMYVVVLSLMYILFAMYQAGQFGISIHDMFHKSGGEQKNEGELLLQTKARARQMTPEFFKKLFNDGKPLAEKVTLAEKILFFTLIGIFFFTKIPNEIAWRVKGSDAFLLSSPGSYTAISHFYERADFWGLLPLMLIGGGLVVRSIILLYEWFDSGAEDVDPKIEDLVFDVMFVVNMYKYMLNFVMQVFSLGSAKEQRAVYTNYKSKHPELHEKIEGKWLDAEFFKAMITRAVLESQFKKFEDGEYLRDCDEREVDAMYANLDQRRDVRMLWQTFIVANTMQELCYQSFVLSRYQFVDESIDMTESVFHKLTTVFSFYEIDKLRDIGEAGGSRSRMGKLLNSAATGLFQTGSNTTFANDTSQSSGVATAAEDARLRLLESKNKQLEEEMMAMRMQLHSLIPSGHDAENGTK